MAFLVGCAVCRSPGLDHVRLHALGHEGLERGLQLVAGRRRLAKPDGVVGWVKDPLYRRRANHDSPQQAMNFSSLF